MFAVRSVSDSPWHPHARGRVSSSASFQGPELGWVWICLIALFAPSEVPGNLQFLGTVVLIGSISVIPWLVFPVFLWELPRFS